MLPLRFGTTAGSRLMGTSCFRFGAGGAMGAGVVGAGGGTDIRLAGISATLPGAAAAARGPEGLACVGGASSKSSKSFGRVEGGGGSPPSQKLKSSGRVFGATSSTCARRAICHLPLFDQVAQTRCEFPIHKLSCAKRICGNSSERTGDYRNAFSLITRRRCH